MDKQTKQVVANALDNALTTVAMREYNRLAYYLQPDHISDNVADALNALGSLQSGDMPGYDEWISLFYHWYQPSQINLAYSMIKSLTGVSEKLYVVGFGCGALAMQFGVALAAADALEQMQPISEIRIDSFDSSRDMIEMGEKIWEQFKMEVSRFPSLRYLSLACEVINSQKEGHSSFDIGSNHAWATAWDSERWVSAMHVIYDDNRDDIQHWLNVLVSNSSPNVCFATTHFSKGNLLQEAWGFMDYDEYYLPPLTITPQFRGVLSEITRWRKSLNSTLQINHRFLERNVTWEWPEAAFMIHTKGPIPMDADDLPW